MEIKIWTCSSQFLLVFEVILTQILNLVDNFDHLWLNFAQKPERKMDYFGAFFDSRDPSTLSKIQQQVGKIETFQSEILWIEGRIM